MRGFSRSTPAPFEEPTVNLTPLIDVVFVILIGFILVAPLLEIDEVELADASSASISHQNVSLQEGSPVAIHVKQDNAIWFDQRRVTADELGELLKKAKQRYPKATPQLFHDKRGHFGTYQAVKNALEAAGFEQVDVILKPS